MFTFNIVKCRNTAKKELKTGKPIALIIGTLICKTQYIYLAPN